MGHKAVLTHLNSLYMRTLLSVWSLCRCPRCLQSSWCSFMVWLQRKLLPSSTNIPLHQRKLTSLMASVKSDCLYLNFFQPWLPYCRPFIKVIVPTALAASSSQNWLQAGCDDLQDPSLLNYRLILQPASVDTSSCASLHVLYAHQTFHCLTNLLSEQYLLSILSEILHCLNPVSYTHLTLPTIYSV